MIFELTSRYFYPLKASAQGELHFITCAQVLIVSCQVCCNEGLIPSDRDGHDCLKH